MLHCSHSYILKIVDPPDRRKLKYKKARNEYSLH